ncbi:S-adenosyl-L-methionine-dependent methyltransferase [Talaromyces proteolyticus]|uniref:S-adenosyl-L-methionine-dependent methyltransferase n=1 Tax=Talaromyces proteolyticus TaxID=1131652 RepID=A0AAD4KX20_9EURO|nr:S-adenosyl-L-methionine-dependent methyltransferase [Talaromyces proteolyticus]KAH8698793.1 S-adenosyl-L-methionine-dependent methyltransferase [Talaromyces proteolyticus]
MSLTTTNTPATVETPFTTGALSSDADFWAKYIASRPTPSEEFFRVIQDYHSSHGDSTTALAHDVGTGPGNIAERLLRYYDHVVGSDVNKRALVAAPSLIPQDKVQRMTFVHSPAENLLAGGVVPADVGAGKTDLVVVSECMPLLDAPKALDAFHGLLRVGGTLAIYFYGRPIFTSGQDPAHLDSLYDRIATKICSFLLPFKGTPGFPFHKRGAEALVSCLDNIPLPSGAWADVVRYKWNTNVTLLFNSKAGFDFDFEPVDRREDGEVTKEIRDRTWWQDEWDADRVKSYLDSVYPSYIEKAGDRYVEIEQGIEELREAMGGGKVKVSFPVALILATKK